MWNEIDVSSRTGEQKSPSAQAHGHDVVSHFDVCDALADGLYDSTTFMAEYDGECTFRIVARELQYHKEVSG